MASNGLNCTLNTTFFCVENDPDRAPTPPPSVEFSTLFLKKILTGSLNAQPLKTILQIANFFQTLHLVTTGTILILKAKLC